MNVLLEASFSLSAPTPELVSPRSPDFAKPPMINFKQGKAKNQRAAAKFEGEKPTDGLDLEELVEDLFPLRQLFAFFGLRVGMIRLDGDVEVDELVEVELFGRLSPFTD